MCSIGLDAPFSSGLLRPLCDVVSPPSAESEPLCLVGYVTEVLALPCLDKKSGRATASSASSPSSPCGTGAGGDGGGGVCVCVLNWDWRVSYLPPGHTIEYSDCCPA